jgi:hypothetical protein
MNQPHSLSGYCAFIESFERLTPFELDHFSKLFYQSFTSSLDQSNFASLKQDDLRDVITQTMQKAHIVIAKKKIEQAKLDYDLIKSRLLVQEDVRQ